MFVRTDSKIHSSCRCAKALGHWPNTRAFCTHQRLSGAVSCTKKQHGNKRETLQQEREK